MTCGEHKLNTNEPFQVDLTVTEIVVHPKFKSAETGFDIAVYKVNSNESMSPVSPVFHTVVTVSWSKR